MTSQVTSYMSDLIAQIISPATTIIGADFTQVRAETRSHPWAFIYVESDEIVHNCQNIIEVKDIVGIIVRGKNNDEVITACEELMTVMMPYTSSNAMYDHGVRSVRPLSRSIPWPAASEALQGYTGEVVFEFLVRYIYT